MAIGGWGNFNYLKSHFSLDTKARKGCSSSLSLSFIWGEVGMRTGRSGWWWQWEIGYIWGRTDRMSKYISIMGARFLTVEEVNCEYGEGRKLE